VTCHGLSRLYPVLDTAALERAGCEPEAAARAMVEAGARLLQFRHKGHYSRRVFEQAERVAAVCARGGAALIIDDRADIALLLDAGLHVGQDDIPPADARRLIGPGQVLGYSTHDAEQLAAAVAEPLDYVAFGPVFPTGSKERPDPVVGLGGIRDARRLVGRRSLVAIGGITRANALDVLAAGADSVAVIADLIPEPCTPETLRARMDEWQRLLNQAAV
jgi:thiamine-phosphate pyrophosphorylase